MNSDDDMPLMKKKAKNTGTRKVSLLPRDLQPLVFAKFREEPEYKLSELSNMLNHPHKGLKEVLDNIADYNSTKKTYTLKKEF